MEFQEVMQRFIALEYSLAWGGPRHPNYPNATISEEIVKLWLTYPSLKKDKDFVDFIEIYAGAIIIYPDNSVDVGINGLWDYTMHLLYEEGAYDGEFLIFSEILLNYPKRNDGDLNGISFAFKLLEMPSVYWHKNYEGDIFNPHESTKYELYCDTFIEWLDRLVKANGRLVS